MMKIAVYAIARDEAKHAERWFASMKEADGVFVLDTGSTDGTQDILRSLGAVVQERDISPWNFAVARNFSLNMIPEAFDILVCTDLDEVFSEGWADRVRECFAANPEANSMSCEFFTKFDINGNPEDSMRYWKIHKRRAGAYWKDRVHEYLEYPFGRAEVFCDKLHLEHHPDNTKSRGQYLELLKGEYEDSHTARSAHYYGRELMFRGMYDEAIKVLEDHITMPSSTWEEERAWSMRYIGKCHYYKADKHKAMTWFWMAASECDWIREPLIDIAELSLVNDAPKMCLFACNIALSRQLNHGAYFTELPCWSWKPYALRADAYFRLGLLDGALEDSEVALSLSPNGRNARLEKNISHIKTLMKEG